MGLFAPQPRIILMIGDDGIVTVPTSIANAAPFFTPNDNKNGTQEIIAFLSRHPTAGITLFIDNLAQDYRSDVLPHLNFFDRMKLARRRLKQNFPSSRLTAWLRFRKSWHQILMVGLHDSNPALAWAERLRDRMPSIALLPVEGARLVRRLSAENAKGWLMSVSRHKSGGFRQIVTLNGDLVFTRLTPLPQIYSRKNDGEIIARDIKASLDYLTRHGLRQSLDLAVLVLMRGGEDIADAFDSLSLKSVTFLSPHAAAQKLQLSFAPAPDDDAGDLLFAAALAAAYRPALPLMLRETRQVWQTHMIQQWGLRVAVTALILAAGHALWSAGDLVETLAQTEKQSALLNESQKQLAEARASAAPVTEPLGRLRQALERRRIFQQPTPQPWAGLNALASGMGAQSKIVKLEWKKDSDTTPEVFTVALRPVAVAADSGEDDDPHANTAPDTRAETVAAFARTTKSIAQAMPDYVLSVTRTPYPDLPQDAVTAAVASADPVGEITLQRKAP